MKPRFFLKFFMAILMIFMMSTGIIFAGPFQNNATPVTSGPNYLGSQNWTTETWLAPAAASGTAWLSHSISTATLISGTTVLLTTRGDVTAITGYPRNISAVIDFASGTSTSVVAATLTIRGITASGLSVNELINVTTTTAYSHNAWRSVSEMDWAATSINSIDGLANCNLKAGFGNAFGVGTCLLSASDILFAFESSSAIAPSGVTVNTTYNTITPAATPNGSLNLTYGLMLRPQ